MYLLGMKFEKIFINLSLKMDTRLWTVLLWKNVSQLTKSIELLILFHNPKLNFDTEVGI